MLRHFDRAAKYGAHYPVQDGQPETYAHLAAVHLAPYADRLEGLRAADAIDPGTNASQAQKE